MPEIISLNAAKRTLFGKGPSRRDRAAGNTPAVIYGHGTEPQHVTLNTLEFLAALRAQGANAVFELKFDGESQLTLVKAIAQNPVTRIIEHLDLLIVRRGEKVEVGVPVKIEGEPISGTFLNVDADEIMVSADALSIPEEVTVSVQDAEIGLHIHASDIALPSGVTLISDPEMLILSITEPVAADTGESEEATEEGEATEGEAAAE